MLLLLAALLPVEGNHLRPERCSTLQILPQQMPQERTISLPSSPTSHTDGIKQFKMKRNPRKLKWTKAFRKAAGKEMVVDSTLNFAARRNVPVRYDRDLVEKTVKAMERVSEIRVKRERVFYKKRMAGKLEREREANRKLVAENEHLLPKMRASERAALEENGEEVEELPLEREKSKVFGKMKQRRKVLVDGGVEDEMDVD